MIEGRGNGYAHGITHKLGKRLEFDPVWNTTELDSVLFAQKRFFRSNHTITTCLSARIVTLSPDVRFRIQYKLRTGYWGDGVRDKG